MTPDLSALRDPEIAALRDAHFRRLEALFAGQLEGPAFRLWGRRGYSTSDPYTRPDVWVREALADLTAHVEALRDPQVFRPLVIEFGPYGVHFVDRIFGAHVYELREPGNWQAQYLSAPVGSLEPPDLSQCPTWGLARALAEAFIEAAVSVPLFGLPTLSSALNVFLNLYGPNGLEAMVGVPEAAASDLRIINDAIIGMHRWYLENLPAAQVQSVVADSRTQPPGFGQLCGCSTQLVSGDLYREIIAPLDEALLSAYPEGGMIHLCGTHTQHMQTWRDMKAVRAIQVNDRAAEDLHLYFDGLREDQIIYANACEGMPVERIVEITNGRRVVSVAPM